ncbi:hypothetical protein KC19_8G021700 [Ceratodon purpureus]|uniref:DUF4216 domain-containing protein n=1 Tax=Ceratodon purpureus TaxID=3225 RepID=A0A8T0GWP1_CERPU|nr:hypothetical protein KC19_8G021700 [Ceratodon purpureus]
MATGYMVDESLGFCTEYFSLYRHTRRRVWDPEEEMRDAGELLLGKPKQKRLTTSEREHVHDYVIKHSVYTSELLQMWEEEKSEWNRNRADFRRTSRSARPGTQQYTYPEHLLGPFPLFSNWLYRHVRMLIREDFPVSPELKELHCPPSDIAFSFKAMWAYGCHYRCNPRGIDSHVSFDCGIASISEDSTTLDVGILKRIFLITYGKLNSVVMEGDWIKNTDQGRAAVKKDRLGFWSVLYNARANIVTSNPYIFPASVSQVYFMNDALQEEWKVVLRHEPRARRVTEDKEFVDFETAGERFAPPEGLGQSDDAGRHAEVPSSVDDEILPAGEVQELAREAANEELEAFLDDADYEDEVDLQYVE